MIKVLCYTMIISDRADRSDPGGLKEYVKHKVGQRTSIYHVGTDKGPLVIGRGSSPIYWGFRRKKPNFVPPYFSVSKMLKPDRPQPFSTFPNR